MNWNNLDITPPDEFLEVQDKDGNIGIAQPTYYPFDVVKMPGDERKPYGLRGTVVFHENNEMKWDGGWMIDATNDWTQKIGDIIKWRKLDESLHN